MRIRVSHKLVRRLHTLTFYEIHLKNNSVTGMLNP